jgi:predicted kinase
MFKLVSLLKEAIDKPKAIFLGGPAGSGKSYISKQLLPSNLNVVNVDDTYEELLKSSGLGLKQKDFSPEELSQAAKLMGQAQKITKEKYAEFIKNAKDVIIDGTGGASRPLLKKKQELEDLGYETFMLMIYVSPLVSLERNKERERSLMPSIVLRTWRDVNQNIDTYQQEFGDNFVLINNNPKEAIQDFSKELTAPYFKDSGARGKEKSPEEIEKSKKEKEQLNQDIENLVQSFPEFNSLEQAKQKINNFLK